MGKGGPAHHADCLGPHAYLMMSIIPVLSLERHEQLTGEPRTAWRAEHGPASRSSGARGPQELYPSWRPHRTCCIHLNRHTSSKKPSPLLRGLKSRVCTHKLCSLHQLSRDSRILWGGLAHSRHSSSPSAPLLLTSEATGKDPPPCSHSRASLPAQMVTRASRDAAHLESQAPPEGPVWA